MKLSSQALSSSEGFQANRAAHLDALAHIRAAAEQAAAGGGERSRDRHLSRGKMLPRERVANLLDPGSAFLEVGATAAHGMYDGAAPAAGIIAVTAGARIHCGDQLDPGRKADVRIGPRDIDLPGLQRLP